ncbi:MAG: class I SAM-dependent methyltransferase [Anaerolineae bacterium]
MSDSLQTTLPIPPDITPPTEVPEDHGLTRKGEAVRDEHQQYRTYELDEDVRRIDYHYERPPEFFYLITGGEWNAYSCSLWQEGFTMTQAQERKFDLYAEMLELKPGMKIMDVGAGWGGPLVYLCQKYGCTGIGITTSPIQADAARARAKKHGVDVEMLVTHWENLPEIETVDAILTDEVIVHFHNLGGFFAKAHRLLRPGRMMVNKELHFASTQYTKLDRVGEAIFRAYDFTGNYIPLWRELQLLDENCFKLERIVDIPMSQYWQTMDEWLKNCFEHREQLKALTSPEHYKEFRLYLKAARVAFTSGQQQLHMVAARKM